MNPGSHLAIIDRVFTALLWFYPDRHREEFADEMQEVFSQAARDASANGSFSLGLLLVNELVAYPGAVLRAHLQTQNATPAGASLNSTEKLSDLSWRELLVAMAVFILPALMLLLDHGSSAEVVNSQQGGWSLVILFLGVMLLAGLLRGVPLLSIPYLGLILVVAGYLYTFQWIAGLVSPALISNFSPGAWDHSTYLVLKVISSGMLWLMLFCLTLLVVALMSLLNRFQPLFKRTSRDWTMLSYILYGESVFALLFLFEHYRFESSYIIAGVFCLGIGVWYYLRSSAGWKRILALVGGFSLAMWVAVIGASPGFAPARQLMLTWLGMLVMLLLPALLARRKGQADPDNPGGDRFHASWSV